MSEFLRVLKNKTHSQEFTRAKLRNNPEDAILHLFQFFLVLYLLYMTTDVLLVACSYPSAQYKPRRYKLRCVAMYNSLLITSFTDSSAPNKSCTALIPLLHYLWRERCYYDAKLRHNELSPSPGQIRSTFVVEILGPKLRLVVRFEVFTAVTMKNGVFLGCYAELSASFIRVMKEALSSSETSVLTRVTPRNIPGRHPGSHASQLITTRLIRSTGIWGRHVHSVLDTEKLI
jgi:hypothetical protein